MQSNVNINAEQQSMEYLKKLVKEYLVFIDTCSWMNDEICAFVDHLIVALRDSGRKIYLTLGVRNELQKFIDDKNDEERRKKALRAAKEINRLSDAKMLAYIGDPHDSFTDNILLSVFNKYRLKNKLALITQDRALGNDILSLNNIQSSKGFPVVVRRINKYAYLSAFDNANGSGRNSAPVSSSVSARISAPKYRIVQNVVSLQNKPLKVSPIPEEGDTVLIDGTECCLDKRLGGGGEGDVFVSRGLPGKVIKIYNERHLDLYRKEKVQLMLSQRINCSGICWPERPVTAKSSGEFVGYVMQEAKGYTPQRSIFIKPLFESKLPNWKRADLVQLCITILEKIEYLHNNNIILGDINPENILIVSPMEVYFVDCDSYQIEGFPCPVGTINFTPPELQGRRYDTLLRSFGNEYFAVATLLFMLMLPGKPPYSQQGGGNPVENIREMNFSYAYGEALKGEQKQPDGPWRFMWSHLPHKLKAMFYKTFRRGEDHSTEATRYTTAEWLSQFREYKNLLGPNGYIIKNDEMSNWIYPTRLKNHKITCKTCGREIMSVDAIRGYCSTCAKDVFQTCAGCGETVYKDHLRFGYCSSCNDVVVKHLICQSCGKLFDYKRGEQLYFRSKGFNDPIRCQECRANKTKGTSTTYSPSGLKSQSTTYTPPKMYTPASLPSRPSSRPATTPVQNPTPSTASSSKKKKLCFITTAVCEYFGKPDDCWELTLLRHFRDHYMKATITGRALVEQYYTIAPDIVRVLDESDQKDLIYSMLWHHYIRPCLRLIVEEKPEECQQLYRAMVEMLINNLNGLDKSVQTGEEYETDEADDVISTPGIALDSLPVPVLDEHSDGSGSDESTELICEWPMVFSEEDPNINSNDQADDEESLITLKDGDEHSAGMGSDESTEPFEADSNTSENSAVSSKVEEKEDTEGTSAAQLPLIPVVFCVDISRNLDEEASLRLNSELRECIDSLSTCESFRSEVCVVTVDSRAEVLMPFIAATEVHPTVITSKGRSMHISEGINLSLSLIEQWKKEHAKTIDFDGYLPTLVMMTAGKTIGESIHDRAVAIDTLNSIAERSITVVTIKVGSTDADYALQGLNANTKGEDLSLAAAVNFIRQRKEVLVSDPPPRIAVALCLDNSGSMEGAPIAELNEGVKAFFDAVLSDEKAREEVEICVVAFGGPKAGLLQDFCSIQRQEVPFLSTCKDRLSDPSHFIGEAVNMALDMLERRTKEYQDAGVDYYQPWLVLMTDGEPYGEDVTITQDGDNLHITREAMRRATGLVNNKKLTILPIGVGADVDMETLKGFSPKIAPMKLQGLKFKEFFEWLSKSAQNVSGSRPGDSVRMPDTTGWGSLDVWNM